MPDLIELPFSLSAIPLTDDVKALIEAASTLCETFESERGPDRIGGFRGTDGLVAWSALSEIKATIPDCGTTFCEWGSGLGIVACVAEKLGWEASGLDIEPRLVNAANTFAKDHKCAAEFHIASYKPDGMFEGRVAPDALDTGFGFGLFDFDVIYGYIWPAEVEAVTQFVADHGRPGSLFLRYRGGMDFKVFRVPE